MKHWLKSSEYMLKQKSQQLQLQALISSCTTTITAVASVSNDDRSHLVDISCSTELHQLLQALQEKDHYKDSRSLSQDRNEPLTLSVSPSDWCSLLGHLFDLFSWLFLFSVSLTIIHDTYLSSLLPTWNLVANASTKSSSWLGVGGWPSDISLCILMIHLA